MQIELHLPNGASTIHLSPEDGPTLSQALRRRGSPLNTRCGERGLCKACTVEVLRNGSWQTERACSLEVQDGLSVRVPASALLAYEPQAVSDFRIGVSYALDPLFGSSGLGFAVDIGTTTVALALVDLSSGKILSRQGAFNQQMKLGDDVLTRINHCLVDPDKVAELQRAVVLETIAPLAALALEEAGASMSDVRGGVVAGNTTMLHLVLGVNPGPLGSVPFTPAFLEQREVAGSEIGLKEWPRVVTLPGASAYVGADIVAGMAATGFAYHDAPQLFVDAGTNGEMVVYDAGRFVGCATAAGPAFEGSGLSCGVRAGRGAVSHITIHSEPVIEVIGGDEAGRPIGICGSAYVDFLAQARKAGLISASGRLTPQSGSRQGEYGKEFELCLGQGKRPIIVSDADIALLLQAKAAISAGVKTLLNRVGLEPDEVETAHLAGGFGMHLNLENTIACGLIPGFRPDQIDLVGNTSLAGAYLALVDKSILGDMTRHAAEIEVIELNQDPDFEDCYIDSLSLDDP